jgi:hypothetical protein
MAVEETLEGLFSTEEITAEKILNLLIESGKNLNMKTQTESPLEIALLEAYIIYLRGKGLTGTAKMLENFMLRFKEFMVSYKRMSRKEIVDSLIALREQKTGSKLTNKLLGMKE